MIRAGWQWVSVEGQASLVGPDDPEPGVDDERLRLLLREIFSAAGGTHEDWAEFDRTMKTERRTAVFVAHTQSCRHDTDEVRGRRAEWSAGAFARRGTSR